MEFMEAVCKLRGKGLSHSEVNEIIKAFQSARTVEERTHYATISEEIESLKTELDGFRKGLTRINGKYNKLSDRVDDIEVIVRNTKEKEKSKSESIDEYLIYRQSYGILA